MCFWPLRMSSWSPLLGSGLELSSSWTSQWHLTQLSFVSLSFSGSNLSSLIDSFFSFCICKCTFHRDSVFLSCLSVPLRNYLHLISNQCVYLSPSVILYAKVPLYRSLCPPRFQAPLGAPVPGIQLAARSSVHTNPKEQTLSFKLCLQVDWIESTIPII